MTDKEIDISVSECDYDPLKRPDIVYKKKEVVYMEYVGIQKESEKHIESD